MESFFRKILIIAGFLLIFMLPIGFYRWPAVFRWNPYNEMYEHMLIALYVVIGIFLVVASFDWKRYYHALWLIVWLNIAHGGVMTIDALRNPEEMPHLFGDIPLTLGGGLLLCLLLLKMREVYAAQRASLWYPPNAVSPEGAPVERG